MVVCCKNRLSIPIGKQSGYRMTYGHLHFTSGVPAKSNSDASASTMLRTTRQKRRTQVLIHRQPYACTDLAIKGNWQEILCSGVITLIARCQTARNRGNQLTFPAVSLSALSSIGGRALPRRSALDRMP